MNPYLNPNLKLLLRDYKLSECMVDYWANFMRNGDPNGEGLPVWKPCVGEEDVMVLE